MRPSIKNSLFSNGFRMKTKSSVLCESLTVHPLTPQRFCLWISADQPRAAGILLRRAAAWNGRDAGLDGGTGSQAVLGRFIRTGDSEIPTFHLFLLPTLGGKHIAGRTMAHNTNPCRVPALTNARRGFSVSPECSSVPGGCQGSCASPAHLRDARELVVTWSRCCRATSAFCLAAANPAWLACSASISSLEFLSSAWGERAKSM